MSPKDAKAVAGLMRRQHGDYAEKFIARQIMHFQQETACTHAVAAWRMVAGALTGDTVAQRARVKTTNQVERANVISSQARASRAA